MSYGVCRLCLSISHFQFGATTDRLRKIASRLRLNGSRWSRVSANTLLDGHLIWYTALNHNTFFGLRNTPMSWVLERSVLWDIRLQIGHRGRLYMHGRLPNVSIEPCGIINHRRLSLCGPSFMYSEAMISYLGAKGN